MRKPAVKIFWRKIGTPPLCLRPKFNSWKHCLVREHAVQGECTNWRIPSSSSMKYRQSQFVWFTCLILQFAFSFNLVGQQLFFALLPSRCSIRLRLYNVLWTSSQSKRSSPTKRNCSSNLSALRSLTAEKLVDGA